jgi:CheY-like chemotaxis protein
MLVYYSLVYKWLWCRLAKNSKIEGCKIIMLFIQTKNRYYHSHFHSSPSLEKEMPFRHSYSNNGDSLKKIYLSESSSRATSNYLRNQGSRLDTIIETETKVTLKPPSIKRILLVDDDPDITLTFKAGLDGHYYGNGEKKRFEVYTYNDPLLVLKEFKPDFYDLLLIDIYMPEMNGFESCEKILELDVNIRVCFMSAFMVNIQALREVYHNVNLGCFIEKPVSIEYLIQRLASELD